MSYVKSILQEEYDRLSELSKEYHARIKVFPKGSVSIKPRKGIKYLYLAFRKEGKVCFDYIGPVSSSKADDIIKKIDERNQYISKLKQVKQDMKEIKKALNGRKI